MRRILAAFLTIALLQAAVARAQELTTPIDLSRPPAPTTPARPGEAEPWLPHEQPHDEQSHVTIEEAEPLPCWPRLSLRADYLYWWFKDMPLPPVLSTGIATDTLPGAIGMPGTKVLFGGLPVEESPNAGVRAVLSAWLDPDSRLGVELGGFFLASRTAKINPASSGGINSPILSQPFFNVGTGQEDISVIASPGIASGSVDIETEGRLWGAEANALVNFYQYRRFRIDGLAGFRYLQLHESVSMNEQTTGLPGLPLIGGLQSTTEDHFSANSNFYGGQFGLRSEIHSGRLFLELQAKVALGATQETTDIAGQTTINQPGIGSQTFEGGLFALSSNSGRHSASAFAVLPEGDVNAGWQPFDHLQFQVGYSFIYLSRLARAGAQVDRNLNPNLIPGSTTFGEGGPALPSATPVRQSSFWLQGLNFGLAVLF